MIRISTKFKKLTKKTYPNGHEHELTDHLPKGCKMDEFDNYYIQIGETTTMFTCHLDTASYEQTDVVHIQEGDFIKTDGKSILGADDKAGMIIMLYMIENKIPGLYYFFIGEERGCIGSMDLSNSWYETKFSEYITKVISFDRKGYDSVITMQMFDFCCSDEFAEELSNRLNKTGFGFNFKPDPTGIYTDSAQFMGIVPECTNISVGYYGEHTTSEIQNIAFLRKLCKAVCLVDWESLPVKNLIF